MIPEAASKLSRSFLIAHFLPAALFVVFLQTLAPRTLEWLPSEMTGLDAAGSSKGAAILNAAPPWTAMFLAAAAVAVLLQAFNPFLIKLYEGIWPRWNPVWIALRALRVGQFADFERRIEALRKSPAPKDQDLAFSLEQQRCSLFPTSFEDVLPTAVGNTIAAWEHYPYRRYGMDAITMWPRLAPLLPKNVAAGIAGAKERFDLILNSATLLLVSGILLWAFDSQPLGPRAIAIYAGIVAGWFALLQMLVTAARWWGENVKAAFDLYRIELLRRIGVSLPPQWDADTERKLWKQLGWSMKYRRDPDVTFSLPPVAGDEKDGSDSPIW